MVATMPSSIASSVALGIATLPDMLALLVAIASAHAILEALAVCTNRALLRRALE